MAYDVFISYSRQNSTSLANYLYQALQGSGYLVFMDVHRQDGAGLFPDHLRKGIVDSRMFVCLLSETTLNSDWVRREIEIAYENHKVMIPIFQQKYIAPSPIPSKAIMNLLNSQGQKYYDLDGLFYEEATKNVISILSQTVLPRRPPNKFTLWIRSRLRWLEEHPVLTGLIGTLLAIVVSIVLAQQTNLVRVILENFPTATSIVAEPTRVMPTSTQQPSPTLSVTSSISETPIEIANIAKTDDANHTATAQAIMAEWMASWTDTPTVTLTPTANITASLEAYRAEQTATAQAITAEWIAIWTATPTLTLTPTETATASPTTGPDPLEIAKQGVDDNAEWFEYVGIVGVTERDFNGHVMVLVPSGRFEMGSSDEEINFALELCNEARQDNSECERGWFEDEAPKHPQIVSEPFWIDKYEVTREQYKRCVDSGECQEVGTSEYSNEENQPINNVTWYMAHTYCNWQGGRLATEVEWEYSARGPSRKLYPWGDEMIGTEANHCDSNCAEGFGSGFTYKNPDHNDGYEMTSKVDEYPEGVSWVGAFNMAGNLWEWVDTPYKNYPITNEYYGDTEDNSTRVLRGGSFNYSSNGLRSANRSSWVPLVVCYYGGFRCARS